MKTRQFDAVVFDMDGVIFDSERAVMDCWTTLAEKYNITRPQEQYDQATIQIDSDKTVDLLKTLNKYNVKFISELPYTLEKHFKNILINKKENKSNVQ